MVEVLFCKFWKGKVTESYCFDIREACPCVSSITGKWTEGKTESRERSKGRVEGRSWPKSHVHYAHLL
jgi:hypothetical protein